MSITEKELVVILCFTFTLLFIGAWLGSAATGWVYNHEVDRLLTTASETGRPMEFNHTSYLVQKAPPQVIAIDIRDSGAWTEETPNK